MSTVTAQAMPVAPIGRMLWMETRAKFVARLRNPAFTVLSLGLPVMFFLLFDAIFGSLQAAPGVSTAKLILVSYATYGVGNVMVYNFGIGLANDRGRKLDLLQRATPLPPFVATLAYVIGALIFALLSLILLGLVATVIGGARLEAGTRRGPTRGPMVGSVPMSGPGVAIRPRWRPHAAPALANKIYLPGLGLPG